ncbi:hypothetical protein V1225_06040 [Emergencia sp. JLR.KK010]|uniref:hypothetical protein n=1 Tax=Emergencia sp. JLR.KK010 TaxID=3114296 RepID=UPI0030D49BCE
MGKAKIIGGGGGGRFTISNGVAVKKMIKEKLKTAAYVIPSVEDPIVTRQYGTAGSVSLGGYEPGMCVLDDGGVAIVHSTSYATGVVVVVSPDGTVLQSESGYSGVMDVYGVFQVEPEKFCAIGFDYSNYLQWSLFVYDNNTIFKYASGTIKTVFDIKLKNFVHVRDGVARLYVPQSTTLNWLELSVNNNQVNATTGKKILSGFAFGSTGYTYTLQNNPDKSVLVYTERYNKSSSYSSRIVLVELDSGKAYSIFPISGNAGDIYRRGYSSTVYHDGCIYCVAADSSGSVLYKLEKSDSDKWIVTYQALLSEGNTAVLNSINATAMYIYNEHLVVWFASQLVVFNIVTNNVVSQVNLTNPGYYDSKIALNNLLVITGYIYSSGSYVTNTYTYTTDLSGVNYVVVGRGESEMVMPANPGNKLIECYA